jgi:uncharacterized protein YoxC
LPLLSSISGGVQKRVEEMRRNFIMILALGVIAMVCFTPVAAKAPDNPPDNGPKDNLPALIAVVQAAVNDILANVNQILTKTDAIQSDVDNLQTTMDSNFTEVQVKLSDIHDDVADIASGSPASGYVVYTSGYIHNNFDGIFVTVDAPAITEDVPVDVTIYNSYGDYSPANNWFEAGDCGSATLTPSAQSYGCGQMGDDILTSVDLIIVKIKVPRSQSDKIIFKIQHGTDIYQPTDFKADETV